MIVVAIPGKPVAQGRPRFARRGEHVIAYSPKTSSVWKKHAKACMAEAVADGFLIDDEFFEGPLELTVLSVFPVPKSKWRKRKPIGAALHYVKPDADNLLKAVLDAGTGILWKDDCQIVKLRFTKVIAPQEEEPLTVLRVDKAREDTVLTYAFSFMKFVLQSIGIWRHEERAWHLNHQ